ncbi:uncharacterized protein LOC114713084 [Neltuma alba]|uniref:uncharacterized protein LOC114713084 n=1 Tax=Neltuma alba TaxID=207710 RepID=UPI0010A4D4DA|nr:uncharacterized protein LOC114713084 [Prosopis alba]
MVQPARIETTHLKEEQLFLLQLVTSKEQRFNALLFQRWTAIAFKILQENCYFVKRSKCAFAAAAVDYLGHIIKHGTVSTDPQKIEAVVNWPTPSNIKQLRGFLGLTGYYRRFIKGYGDLARTLTLLLQKNAFQWSDSATQAFQTLKDALTSAPVLRLPDFSKEFIVETDACGTGIGAVLMQEG